MAFTCGKCGATVNDGDSHIAFHIYHPEGKPLFSFIAVKDRSISLLVGKGFHPFKESIFINPEEYDMGCDKPGVSYLQNELIQIVTREKGHLEEGLHSLPRDISDYPAIAQALTMHVQTYFPNHWEASLNPI